MSDPNAHRQLDLVQRRLGDGGEGRARDRIKVSRAFYSLSRVVVKHVN